MKIQVKNETNRLRAVILGTAQSNGATPTAQEAYDPKSLEHILAGTYPKEADMIPEMEAFAQVLKKYEVEVYRPELIENCNQIFTRDIGFVIEDKFIKANILPEREEEYQAIEYIVRQIPPSQYIVPSPEIHIEGGDVMPWNDHIFVGTYYGADYANYKTARTNREGVKLLKALHIEREEMYQMFSNVFSISPEVVVSERNFTRLNNWLREQGFTVEEIPYAEIAKQEGLLRCSTLPLLRD